MSRYTEVHRWANLKGPGDARPTAMQIIQDCGMQKDGLEGRNVVVTGVSSGIGTETALALASAGANLYCAGRSIDKAKASLASIADRPNVHFVTLDVANNTSVRDCAADIIRLTGGVLHVLVNNAGATIAERKTTVDGFESSLGINYIGQFLLFSLLRDALLAGASSPQGPARVVNVASVGHRHSRIHFDDLMSSKGDYNPSVAYGQAKTACIYMANEIERRYGSRGLHAWSLQPGAVMESRFLANSGWSNEAIQMALSHWPKEMFKSCQQGAATQVWAVVSNDALEMAGRYLENCTEAVAHELTEEPNFMGYWDHIYDEADAKKLWSVTEELLGL
jgi:NAD(P)-dependent dehydrogenase (short-subunit alcohol dehydrogenase family)